MAFNANYIVHNIGNYNDYKYIAGSIKNKYLYSKVSPYRFMVPRLELDYAKIFNVFNYALIGVKLLKVNLYHKIDGLDNPGFLAKEKYSNKQIFLPGEYKDCFENALENLKKDCRNEIKKSPQIETYKIKTYKISSMTVQYVKFSIESAFALPISVLETGRYILHPACLFAAYTFKAAKWCTKRAVKSAVNSFCSFFKSKSEQPREAEFYRPPRSPKNNNTQKFRRM